MKIHLFGASSLTGKALLDQFALKKLNLEIIKYSRTGDFDVKIDFNNLKHYPEAIDLSEPAILISFAPIWLFSKLLDYLKKQSPSKFKFIKKIIVCSSSSIITKRYAFNEFDQSLVNKLTKSEKKLLDSSHSYKISTTILRPSMIYGEIGNLKDKNISRILTLLRLLPVIFIPERTGLRQPIHINQLAMVVLSYVMRFDEKDLNSINNESILVGGDTTVSYKELIDLLQNSLKNNDNGRRCKILKIPNKIFYTLIMPFLWFSPKNYESLFRISSNLSGFKCSNEILNQKPIKFPVKNYS